MINYLEALGYKPSYIEARNATLDEILIFHTKDYVEALIQADIDMKSNEVLRNRYAIGTIENPVSPGMWKGSLLATGSSIQAVELFSQHHKAFEEFIVFNPAGGMHHAMKSKANGFCFLNDSVITIKHLQKHGFKKILYIDLDAHHPDGVQEAFYDNPDVFTISMHQSPTYAFPFNSGYEKELGIDDGYGFNMNIPLPKFINDSEFLYTLEKAMEIATIKFTPDAFVIQMGVDGLKEDYLSKFMLSNNAYIEAIDIIKKYTRKFILLGGGGYNPISLTRAWSLVWLYLDGVNVFDVKVPKKAQDILKEVDYEDFDELMGEDIYSSLLDEKRIGDIRIKEYLEKIFSLHKLYMMV